MKNHIKYLFSISALLCFFLSACSQTEIEQNINTNISSTTIANDTHELTPTTRTFDISTIPEFSGEAVYIINNNYPFFTENDITTDSFEIYSELDNLNRCGVAFANISKDIMPTEPRGEIGHIKPSGWHTIKYNDIIDGNYLYNRCHLIGYQLAGENDNEKNLITGTRYLNVIGMLPYENQIDDYVEKTNNHVLYRVTPIFIDNELVARGVLMEAYSVEDNGTGICFNIYCYNVQPGITINYQTGDSYTDTTSTTTINTTGTKLILNTNSLKIHTPDCEYASSISKNNRLETTTPIATLLNNGFSPCKVCNPQ